MNTSELFSLKGRTALITGGSRGIGRMIAAGFIAQGARVYISARKAAACDTTAAELAQGGHCVSLPADVSSVEGAKALAAAYGQHESSLDILVNNAGAAWGAPFDEFPESGWAKVINIASIDGISVNPLETYSYAASKSGLIHLTRRMALRLIEDNIVVNAIAPGAFASEMNRDARDNGEAVSARIPAHRIGSDEDMAAAAIYLASRAGDYVVGHTLTVDGGVTIARG